MALAVSGGTIPPSKWPSLVPRERMKDVVKSLRSELAALVFGALTETILMERHVRGGV